MNIYIIKYNKKFYLFICFKKPHVMDRCVLTTLMTVGAATYFYSGDPTLLLKDI